MLLICSELNMSHIRHFDKVDHGLCIYVQSLFYISHTSLDEVKDGESNHMLKHQPSLVSIDGLPLMLIVENFLLLDEHFLLSELFLLATP